MKANISMRRNYISIILLAVFFFAFLGTEYLFDNCMMHVTDMDGVVRAQNYVLGVSAVGFFLYRSAAEFLLHGEYGSLLFHHCFYLELISSV